MQKKNEHRSLTRREMEMLIEILHAKLDPPFRGRYGGMSCSTWTQSMATLDVMGQKFLLVKGKVAYQLQSKGKWFVEIRGMNDYGTGWNSAVVNGDVDRFAQDLILISMSET